MRRTHCCLRLALLAGAASASALIARSPIEITSTARGADIRSGKHTLTGQATMRLYWRHPGEHPWRESAPVRVDGGTAIFEPARAITRHERLTDGSWQFSGTLENTGNRRVELARFHYLDGAIPPAYGLLELQGAGDLRLVRHGDSLPATCRMLEDLWQSMKVFWPRLVDPIHHEPDWGVSTDTGALIPSWNEPGWFAGFTGPGTAFGEIGFHTATPSRFYVGVLLDNSVLDPGEKRTLESFRLMYGDWQEALRDWAIACTRQAPARKPKPPITGYCSWYLRGPEIEPADVLRAATEFTAWPAPPGGRTVQLDDGWQTNPGEWTPNSKFVAAWPSLPKQIDDTGSIPGLWIAPTFIHQTHGFVRNHPEWLQHLPDGRFAIHFANWGGETYPLEIDRPEAKAFMSETIAQTRREGWRYLKIDFTYPLSTARVAWDRKKTSFESQRDLYALIRQTAGDTMLLNACVGEPARYALGQVDIARLGGDTGSAWPIVQSNLRRTLSFAATNGVWWQADPDVYYMRQEKTRLTAEENYVLTGTLGLLGGVFLTSDWPSQWSADAAVAVREFWTSEGPRVPVEHRMALTRDGVIQAYRVTYKPGRGPRSGVGLYNWSDQAQAIRVPLSELGIDSAAAWKVTGVGRSRAVRLRDGALEFDAQPPHSLRIGYLSGAGRSRENRSGTR